MTLKELEPHHITLSSSSIEAVFTNSMRLDASMGLNAEHECDWRPRLRATGQRSRLSCRGSNLDFL